ncbi:hypothetical protein HID58_071275 [Brassica napus]|uniref:Fatty acid hydroxylase domain-containing protein n=1 Tax=Brassica napus TaxID=3708 RepID=A0ABQ7Z182_BRANA|nr:hypothetical protein HID58_071275 [Brassica napus]
MIPYATIEDASLALGRNLTTLESLWFDYSAAKSDYYLYCHNILFLFLLFLIFSPSPPPSRLRRIGAIRLGMVRSVQDSAQGQELLLRHVPLLQRRDEDVHPRRRPFAARLLSFNPMIEIRSGLPLPSFGEIAAQLVVYFLVEDYTNYWVHRFFHSKWGYEKIHHIHHEYTAPIGYALLMRTGLRFCFLGIEAIETHSGYDFPWTLTNSFHSMVELSIMITIITLEDKAKATLLQFHLL